jgi:predicted permease
VGLRKEFSKFKALFSHGGPAADLEEEIQSHLRMEERENRESGMSSEQARLAAMRRFGNVTSVQERSRGMWQWTSVEQIVQDLQFGFRQLRRDAGFTIFAVLTLALGIGASSVIFSLVNEVLLRPLPFARSERLVDVWEAMPKRNIPRLPAAPGNYLDWRTMNHVLESMGGFVETGFSVTSTGDPERYIGALCDEGLFRTLQVAPILGRTLMVEDTLPGRDTVAIVGYGLWRRRFGGDPHILGQNIVIDGRARTIVGVMPEGFSFPERSEIWAPFGWSGEERSRRDGHFVRVIGRLRDGVSGMQARAEFSLIAEKLAKEHPAFDQDELIEVRPVMDDLVGNIRPAFVVLVSAVGFLLLIACSNVANLLLAKAAGRVRELAIRASLGAGRLRIFRQLLVESLLLSLSGGLAGLILAAGAIHAILLTAPGNIPRLADVSLARSAVLFTLALSVLTGIFFGVVPAWSYSRNDLHSELKKSSRNTTARGGLRNALVVLQVSAAVVLMAGAGLLIHSFHALLQVDAGFNPDQVLTARLTPARSKYDGRPGLEIQLARSILRNVAAVPGIEKSAITTDIPIAGNPTFIMRLEGQEVSVSQAPITTFFSVTPSYLEVMGMRLIQGRFFNDSDVAGSPLVAVVNKTLAQKYFPGQNPIGRRIEVTFQDPPRWRQIVGVVADVHSDGLAAATPVQVYTAFLQMPGASADSTPEMSIVARTRLGLAVAGPAMKNAILQADRAQPVFAVQTMDQVMGQSIAERRFALVLIAGFAGLSLFLVAFGIYSVMSYTVAQRTSEIGIRMALGAKVHQVLWLIERQALVLTITGLAGGLLVASLVTRFLKSMLFRIGPEDPATFLGVVVGLLLVGMLSCCPPAWRASQVDPVDTLRQE